MVKIDIILVGYIKNLIDKSYLKNWKSEIFEIENIREVDLSSGAGFSEPVCSFQKIQNEVQTNNNLTIAISNYYFPGNLISNPLSENLISLSIYDFDKTLKDEKLKIEKFIFRFIYAFAIIYETNNSQLPNNTNLIDIDKSIEGCIFDYCRRHHDSLKFHIKPIISNYSKSILGNKNKPDNYVNIIESEIRRLKRSLWESIELKAKENPAMTTVISLIIGFIFGLLTNLIK
ncbi:MAG: hypothetical protein GQ564_15660 [Bacteroidales bacterium]|nr:hypothetical protein [Bacteroidales bacterium]